MKALKASLHIHRNMKIWDFHGGKTPQPDFAENFPKIRVDRPSFFRYPRGQKEPERECEYIHTPVPEGCRRFSATPSPPYPADLIPCSQHQQQPTGSHPPYRIADCPTNAPQTVQTLANTGFLVKSHLNFRRRRHPARSLDSLRFPSIFSVFLPFPPFFSHFLSRGFFTLSRPVSLLPSSLPLSFVPLCFSLTLAVHCEYLLLLSPP